MILISNNSSTFHKPTASIHANTCIICGCDNDDTCFCYLGNHAHTKPATASNDSCATCNCSSPVLERCVCDDHDHRKKAQEMAVKCIFPGCPCSSSVKPCVCRGHLHYSGSALGGSKSLALHAILLGSSLQKQQPGLLKIEKTAGTGHENPARRRRRMR